MSLDQSFRGMQEFSDSRWWPICCRSQPTMPSFSRNVVGGVCATGQLAAMNARSIKSRELVGGVASPVRVGEQLLREAGRARQHLHRERTPCFTGQRNASFEDDFEFHRLPVNPQERADAVHVRPYVPHQVEGAGGHVAERALGDCAAQDSIAHAVCAEEIDGHGLPELAELHGHSCAAAEPASRAGRQLAVQGFEYLPDKAVPWTTELRRSAVLVRH